MGWEMEGHTENRTGKEYIYTLHISQAVAKFCKDYKSHTVPARRDCIFIVALPWGHTNTPVEFCHLEALGRVLTGSIVCSTMRCLLLPKNAHATPPLGYMIQSYSMPVTCRTAYIAHTLRAVTFRFGTV